MLGASLCGVCCGIMGEQREMPCTQCKVLHAGKYLTPRLALFDTFFVTY